MAHRSRRSGGSHWTSYEPRRRSAGAGYPAAETGVRESRPPSATRPARRRRPTVTPARPLPPHPARVAKKTPTRTRNAGSAVGQRTVHRQPRPTHARRGYATGRPPPPERGGWERGIYVGPRSRDTAQKPKGRRERSDGGPGRTRARSHRTGHPGRLHLGGRRRPKPPATAPAAEERGPGASLIRLMTKRPSDRRGPGRNPGPQGAFEVSMINVSCNSH